MPQHPYYEPSPKFIQRHGLHIDEAEMMAILWKNEPDYAEESGGPGIDYHKGTGRIVLFHHNGDPETTPILFDGYLPDEAALESVIKWTNW
ncbi:MAG: hypothetical protein ACRYFX_18945 [Janthinobacterium lividum]